MTIGIAHPARRLRAAVDALLAGVLARGDKPTAHQVAVARACVVPALTGAWDPEEVAWEIERDDVLRSFVGKRARRITPAEITAMTERLAADSTGAWLLSFMDAVAVLSLETNRRRVPKAAASRQLEARVQAATKRWKLSPRQTEVLRLLANGDANRAIAEKLGISAGTTELHVTAVLKKARVDSRTRLSLRLWSGL
jgi:DNA-binding CsgD family transcriptional regulator